MIRVLVESTVFAGLALALHLGGLVIVTGGAGAPGASGALGADSVTLRAADDALAATVAEWTRAPVAQDRTAAPIAAPIPPVADTRPLTAVSADPRPTQTPPAMSEAPPIPSATLPDLPSARPGPTNALPAVSPAPDPPAERALPPPRPRPTTARAPTPALRAAGRGGVSAAGPAETADTPSVVPGRRDRLLAVWGARIRQAVERHKHYPRAAGGATGAATVEISVTGAGQMQRAMLRRSSGHPALDQAALAAVAAVGRFPGAPDGLGPGPQVFTFQMSFDR
jgi:protein TonB